jgi:hypothetical protein
MKNRTKKMILFLVILCLIIPLQSSAQKVDAKIDGQKAFETISYFSSDQFLGRKPNTPEFYKLQDWIVEKYKEWGLEPAGDDGSFFQSVPIGRKYAVNYGMPKMLINGREFYPRYDDFKIDVRSTTNVTIEEEVVFAGYGISAPDKGLDEYEGIDVDGKIVFVLKGNPNDFTPPQPRLMRDESMVVEDNEELGDWDIESTDSVKIATAYEKGASAIIIYQPEGKPDRMARWRPVVEKSEYDRDFIIVSEVSERVFQWLFWTDEQMSSRAFRTWYSGVRTDIRSKKARSMDTGITAEITGFEKTLFKGKEFDDNDGRNIIAKITGSDEKLKNEYVVIGAHLDHVGVRDGQIYNGAEDNASGSGVVFELGRLMKSHKIQGKRTIILCLWTAEELGLIGSEYWVDNPSDNVNIDQVVTYFNMDMVGIGDTIDAPGAMNFPSIWEVIKRDQDKEIMDVVIAHEGGPGGSDQTPFIIKGIEAMALMTHSDDGHPDYHDTGDDGYKLNPDILGKTGQFVLQGTVNLANETDVNLLIPNRENIFNGQYWPMMVIDPSLEAKNGWKWVEANNSGGLSKLISEKVAELKKEQDNSDPYAAMRRRYGTTPRNTGINGPAIFNHDVDFMAVGKDVLNFGRLDVDGDDGVWFEKGVTEKGGAALKTLSKKKIALHLKNPQKATLDSVLDKTRKPILISGFHEFDDDMLAKVKKSKSLIAVDLNTDNIDACIVQLEKYKAAFDTTANILVNVTDTETLPQAKKELYLKLTEKGWTKEEIYPMGGVGLTRRSQGNLDVLPGGRARFPGR